MNILRFVMDDGDHFRKHLREHKNIEQFCFLLAEKMVITGAKIIYNVRQIIFPDPQDLASQSAAFVAPTKRYQAQVYNRAYKEKLTVIDAHTHWFQSGVPSFSSIDLKAARKNAEFLTKNMPEIVDFGFLVFNGACTSFSGFVYDKQKSDFKPFDSIEYVKSPFEITFHEEPFSDRKKDETYSRHYLIPGWKQDILPELKVGVIGAGGNGSLIIQALACMGVGSGRGFLMVVDHDSIERSNLSRIPYAFKRHIGMNKALVAKEYIKEKNPAIKVVSLTRSVKDRAVQKRIQECHILFGAVDSDGARKILSEISHKACIPYIDTGTEIFPKGNSYEACGQVRTIIPRNGCLHCINGINTTESALDLMSGKSKRNMEKAGYIRGTTYTPTPSVIHLNGVIANIAISQFLKYVFGENMQSQKAIFYNQQRMSLVPASFNKNNACPLCGDRPSKEKLQESIAKLKDNLVLTTDKIPQLKSGEGAPK